VQGGLGGVRGGDSKGKVSGRNPGVPYRDRVEEHKGTKRGNILSSRPVVSQRSSAGVVGKEEVNEVPIRSREGRYTPGSSGSNKTWGRIWI